MGTIFLAMGVCFVAMATAAYFLIRDLLRKRQPKTKTAKARPAEAEPAATTPPAEKRFGKALFKARAEPEEEAEEPVYERRRTFATLRAEIDDDQRPSAGGGPQPL